MEIIRRLLTCSEDMYTYSQSSQISSQSGLIGYLRADMDRDGNGFFSSWSDYRKELKTEEFKTEFDDLINSLRTDGEILHNRTALEKYCVGSPEAKIGNDGWYGMRVDTEKYAYLFRLNPNKGEYNMYCYCYIKKRLDIHLHDAQRGIRFITPHYKELFRIQDGEKIVIKYPDGTESIKTCRYIDDYHVEINYQIYHICEFAEKMQESLNIVEPIKEN